MARRRKQYDDDDGRTIADMSVLGDAPRGAFGIRYGGGAPAPSQEEDPTRPTMSKKEQFLFFLGAMKAALLIGLAFVVGLGAIIGLMVLFWWVL